MPYWRLFYHIVWSTKNRLPLITPENELMIFDYVRSKAIGLEATVFALNGMSDHVHMVVSIPPKIAVAKFIGQVKAVASTKFNKSGHSETPLFWQEEYGVFSLDSQRLPNHVSYVERQKEHHAQHSIIPILERTDGGDVTLIREANGAYALDEEVWRRELVVVA